MVRRVNQNTVEEYKTPAAAIYRRRRKLPSVNLYDSPFAIDRQLEDQKFIAAKNKNPQLDAITKTTKIRSEQTVSNHVETPLVKKANVLNKIVRDASGIHTYTIVPPIENPSVFGSSLDKAHLDPETNPILKPYRDENNLKPVLTTYGHRPSSANRTFNPSTMKIKLKPGEVVASSTGKSGFGLPAAMLSQLLHCPSLQSPENASDLDGFGLQGSGFSDLFMDPAEMASITAKPRKPKRRAERKVSDGGYGSGQKVSLAPLQRLSKKSASTGGMGFGGGNLIFQDHDTQEQSDGRPSWDDNVTKLDPTRYQKLKLKMRLIPDSQDLPLKERLTRFQTMAGAPAESSVFCSEKIATDKEILKGQHSPSKMNANSIYDAAEDNPYFDPLVEKEIKLIKKKHIKEENQRTQRIREKLFLDAMDSVPKVQYQPSEVLESVKRFPALKDTSLMHHTFGFESSFQSSDGFEDLSPGSLNPSLALANRKTKGYASTPEQKYVAMESVYFSDQPSSRHSQCLEHSPIGTPSGRNIGTASSSGRRSAGGTKELGGPGRSSRGGRRRGSAAKRREDEDEELMQAIEATKAGDEDALYAFFMRGDMSTAGASREGVYTPFPEPIYEHADESDDLFPEALLDDSDSELAVRKSHPPNEQEGGVGGFSSNKSRSLGYGDLRSSADEDGFEEPSTEHGSSGRNSANDGGFVYDDDVYVNNGGGVYEDDGEDY